MHTNWSVGLPVSVPPAVEAPKTGQKLNYPVTTTAINTVSITAATHVLPCTAKSVKDSRCFSIKGQRGDPRVTTTGNAVSGRVCSVRVCSRALLSGRTSSCSLRVRGRVKEHPRRLGRTSSTRSCLHPPSQTGWTRARGWSWRQREPKSCHDSLLHPWLHW